jgi:hypothetical protein
VKIPANKEMKEFFCNHTTCTYNADIFHQNFIECEFFTFSYSALTHIMWGRLGQVWNAFLGYYKSTPAQSKMLMEKLTKNSYPFELLVVM